MCVPRNGLMLILLIAAAVRVGAILAFPSLYRPDENFQVFEQAHRIAFGYGITPWEFRDGMRSLLLPAMLAKVFSVAEHLGAGPAGYILIAHLLLAALSLVAVAAVYEMGRRTSSTHAMAAGLVCATWFELVYFSFRSLTEAVATDFLLTALALCSGLQGGYSRKRLIGIGFCLGMCLMLRVHLLPGVAVALCWVGRVQFRSRWLPLSLGVLVPVYAFGLFDWITWGHPFQSYLAAFRIDALDGKPSTTGVTPFYWYLQDRAGLWAGALPLILGLLVLRIRASALWFAVAATIIASHSLIPHKESCYVFPAFACLIVVAAMGSADLVQRVQKALGAASPVPITAAVFAFWLATNASLAFAPGFSESWFRQRDLLLTSFWLTEQPAMCGLMLYDRNWYETGGYAYLHRDVPIYSRMLLREIGTEDASGPGSEAAYNFVVLKRRSLHYFTSPFAIDGCFGDAPDDLCIISRPGSCSPDRKLHPLLEEPGMGEWHGDPPH